MVNYSRAGNRKHYRDFRNSFRLYGGGIVKYLRSWDIPDIICNDYLRRAFATLCHQRARDALPECNRAYL